MDRTLEPTRKPALHGEERSFPRHPYQVPSMAKVYSPGAVEAARTVALLTQDLSRGGLRILLCERLFRGQYVDVLTQPFPLQVRVVWCHALAEGCFVAGCEFRTS